MSKSVLMSIQPKWCELIASGKKTIEVRKTKPKIPTPFKVYIYCTKDGKTLIKDDISTTIAFIAVNGGKVIGEFVCDKFDEFTPTDKGVLFKRFSALYEACLSVDEIRIYLGGKIGYGWHISNLVIYDKPKELSEFIRICPEWEKEEITKKCLKCEHHFISNADCFAGCDCEGELSITRPPQSWCYVEELEQC